MEKLEFVKAKDYESVDAIVPIVEKIGILRADVSKIKLSKDISQSVRYILDEHICESEQHLCKAMDELCGAVGRYYWDINPGKNGEYFKRIG